MIKQSALEAVQASKPCAVVFGSVISAEPLQIKVEDKLTLTAPQLVLTRNVTNHTLAVFVDWVAEKETENHVHDSSTPQSAKHDHAVLGDKLVTVYNGLQSGERVVLQRLQGGQKYLVLDRVVET